MAEKLSCQLFWYLHHPVL